MPSNKSANMDEKLKFVPLFIRDAYGGKITMPNMIDEFSRKCLAIHYARRIGSVQVIE